MTSWLTFNAAHLKVLTLDWSGSLAFTLLKARRNLDAMSALKISIQNVGYALLKVFRFKRVL